MRTDGRLVAVALTLGRSAARTTRNPLKPMRRSRRRSSRRRYRMKQSRNREIRIAGDNGEDVLPLLHLRNGHDGGHALAISVALPPCLPQRHAPTRRAATCRHWAPREASLRRPRGRVLAALWFAIASGDGLPRRRGNDLQGRRQPVALAVHPESRRQAVPGRRLRSTVRCGSDAVESRAVRP
jgi:hypothetical protein